LTSYRPPIETNVTTKSIGNTYLYNSRDFWISYGLAIGFALLANIFGGKAFWTNRVAHDRSFSAILSSTRDAALAKIFDPTRLGKLPLPPDVAKKSLRFEKLGEGGWGLILVGNAPAEDESAEDEPVEGGPVEGGPMEGGPANNNPENNNPANDEPVNNKPAED